MLKSQVEKERGKKLKVCNFVVEDSKFRMIVIRFQGKPIFRDAEEDRAEEVVEMNEAPREQLLHASLSTLETMGRHIKQSAMDHSYRQTGKAGVFPSDLYLQGALWLGRNFVMVSEEMGEAMEFFRTKVLREISAVTDDRSDLIRCVNRLSLLAGSTVTEAVEITGRYKGRAREILRGASTIRPGDYQAMSLFLKNLPIDSILEKSNLTTSYGAVESRYTRAVSAPSRREGSARKTQSVSPSKMTAARAASPGGFMNKMPFTPSDQK